MHICIVTLGDCFNNACVNGQCVEEIGPIHCNCSGTGFKGDKCQYGNNNILSSITVNDMLQNIICVIKKSVHVGYSVIEL